MDNNDNNNNEGKKRPQFYESSAFPLPRISAKHLAASGRGDQDSCNKVQLQFLQSVLPGCQKTTADRHHHHRTSGEFNQGRLRVAGTKRRSFTWQMRRMDAD